MASRFFIFIALVVFLFVDDVSAKSSRKPAEKFSHRMEGTRPSMQDEESWGIQLSLTQAITNSSERQQRQLIPVGMQPGGGPGMMQGPTPEEEAMMGDEARPMPPGMCQYIGPRGGGMAMMMGSPDPSGMVTSLGVAAGTLVTECTGLSLNAKASFPNQAGGETQNPPQNSGGTQGQPQQPSGPPGMNQQSAMIGGGVSSIFFDRLKLSAAARHRIDNFQSIQDRPGQSGSGQGPNSIRVSNAPDPSNIMQEQTAFLFGAELGLIPQLAVTGYVPVGLQSGVLDPSAGILVVPFESRFKKGTANVMLDLDSTIPVSRGSQQSGKITTTTLRLNPMINYDQISLGLSSTYSRSFYQPGSQQLQPTPPMPPGRAAVPTPPGNGAQMPKDPESAETQFMNTLTFGYRFTREISASTAGGIGYTGYQDGTMSWNSQANLLGVSYSPGNLTLGATVSFFSNSQNDSQLSMPTQPALTLNLSFLFGGRRGLMGGM